MKKSLVIFLTHNFKPIFSQTLKNFDTSIDQRIDSIILFDENSSESCEINLKNISVKKIKTQILCYDPPTRAHNFVIEFLHNNFDMINKYDYFWVIENDVYFHGSLRWFIDLHDEYECDLLVPEFGLRQQNWGWPRLMTGLTDVQQIGVTAVIHRLSKKLVDILVPGIIDGSFSGHVESLLPHLCIEKNLKIQQFIPDYCCSINTYRNKFLDLIEQDIKNGTNHYIEQKMYHPIKL